MDIILIKYLKTCVFTKCKSLIKFPKIMKYATRNLDTYSSAVAENIFCFECVY